MDHEISRSCLLDLTQGYVVDVSCVLDMENQYGCPRDALSVSKDISEIEMHLLTMVYTECSGAFARLVIS